MGRSRAILASSGSRGPSSPTPTAASTRRRSAASCRPTSASSRSRSASSGRWRSRCASCWSRTCGELAERIVDSRMAGREADALADGLLGIGGRDRRRGAPRCARLDARVALARASPCSWSSGCAIRIRASMPCAALARRASSRTQGTSTDELVRQEHQRQGAMNVTVRNVITSMRLMSAVDWAELLRERQPGRRRRSRPAAHFADMDFPTRDRYRHAIEELAAAFAALRARGGAPRSRPGATKAARRGRRTPRRTRPRLLSDLARPRRRSSGRSASVVPLRTACPARVRARRAPAAYLGHASPSRPRSSSPPCSSSLRRGVGPDGSPRLLAAARAACRHADLAIALANRGVDDPASADARCPKLELRDGVPARAADAGRRADPPDQRRRSRRADRPARDPLPREPGRRAALRAALGLDRLRRPRPCPSDDALLAVRQRRRSRRLNDRHGPAADGGDRFLLLHRRRVWNAGEGAWMGWERKRGKLHELNRLLRGATDTSFLQPGEAARRVPAGVRYVITLDADTRLPRGAARGSSARMAHPAEPRRGSIRAPAASSRATRCCSRASRPTLARRAASGSLFQRVFSGPGGIDPYASAVSDVYQDLFGEGSYTGKGIYDVDAFEAALAGRVPENTLLSHDLFEGIFARAGLVTDIALFEEFPSRYEVAAARQHRWARATGSCCRGSSVGRGADACRLTRAAGRCSTTCGGRCPRPRSSLLLVAGWLLPVGSPALVDRRSSSPPSLLPALVPVLHGVVPRRAGSRSGATCAASAPISACAAHAGRRSRSRCSRTRPGSWPTRSPARSCACVTRRQLLEWVTAAQAKAAPRRRRWRRSWRRMGGVVGARRRRGGSGRRPALRRRGRGRAPFLALWMLSPRASRWAISPPPARRRRRAAVGATRRASLRATARRTWRFFETFVGPEDHTLPPDNFQEDPAPVVAHRTSPTNIGLYLLSTVAARDFGWLGLLDAVDRLERDARHACERLERFRGHFYNWYETQELRPLDPTYVSTVDSGNLAGHLLALREACRELARSPAARRRRCSPASRTRSLVLREALQRSRGRPPHADGHPQAARRRRSTRSPRRSAPTPRRRPRDWARSTDRPRGARGRRRSTSPAPCARSAATPPPARCSPGPRRSARRSRATRATSRRCCPGRGSWQRRGLATLRRRRTDAESCRRRRRARTLAGAPTRVRARRAPAVAPSARATPATAIGAPARPRSRPARADGLVGRDGLRGSCSTGRAALLDRLPRRRRRARSQLLRPARLRGAPRELRRDRQGRRAAVALVPPRPRR